MATLVCLMGILAGCGGDTYAGYSKEDAKAISSDALDDAVRRSAAGDNAVADQLGLPKDEPLPDNWRDQDQVELIDITQDTNSHGNDAWLATYTDKYGDNLCVWLWQSNVSSDQFAYEVNQC
jgi:hypothetical protein